MTLQLLWEEHRAAFPDGYGYSRYCELYRAWEARLSPTMAAEPRRRRAHICRLRRHDARGDRRIDRRGDDGAAVRLLGASNYTYAEATWTQGLSNWIGSHTRTFAFIAGVPAMVVTDNLRPANIDGSAGAVEEVARIVAHPHALACTRIILRADSGFARNGLMASNGIDSSLAWRGTCVLPERSAPNWWRRARKRRAGAPLQGVQLDDAQELEPTAPGHRQGGMDERRGQSALYRHLADGG